MKCRIIVTAIAVALVASVSAFAAKGEKGKGGGGLLPPSIVQSLSAEQKTKYDAILAKAKDAQGDKEKMAAARKDAIAILTDDQKAELKKLAPPKGKDGGKGGKKK
jgi:hypothetical protein